MKIFIIPLDSWMMPSSQPFKYPRHNKDYGIEQDFLAYLHANPHYLTSNPIEADWHYLGIFWTRFHLNNNYGSQNLDSLQAAVSNLIIDDSKTFTICQYDDGPLINLGFTRVFYGSRKVNIGDDVPLLCAPHRSPCFPLRKKGLAGFSGRISTHPIREELYYRQKEVRQTSIKDSQLPTWLYVRDLCSYDIALSPRGYGGSSFRFYEALQLGIVPFMISDIDTRPFKKIIDWEKISFFAKTFDEMKEVLLNVDVSELGCMGERGREIFNKELSYGKWCSNVISTLLS